MIVQFGGQTPLKLRATWKRTACPSSAPRPDMIDCAEDRERFQQLLQDLKLKQPPNRTARTANKR